MTTENIPMKAFAQAEATRIPMADDSVDLVMGSPPYMDARTYGINAQRGVSEWIDFMLKATTEAVRVSRGLVLWVVAGVTRKHCYWPGCEGFLYEWWKRGGRCWRPTFWHRVGIPGSGGKQWLRADVEYVFCFTKCEKYIPWANNTANGHPPKWAPGGEASYRDKDGVRANENRKKRKIDPFGFGGRQVRVRAGVGRIEVPGGESESDVAIRNGFNLASGQRQPGTSRRAN